MLSLVARWMRIGPVILAFGCTPPGTTQPDGGEPSHDAGPSDGGPLDSGSLFCGVDGGHAVTAVGPAINDEPGAVLGYGDPSLVYPAGADSGFMTYTAVGFALAQTRIASSADHGASWTYLGQVNETTPLTISTSDLQVCGASSCSGTWVHEVSSAIDDAADPNSAQRYKVFAHSYFIPDGGAAQYNIGSIDLWTASNLKDGGAWTETRLFGWSSSSPRSSNGVRFVVTTDPTLSSLLGACDAMTEPGAMVRGATIDLALGCERIVSASSVPIEIMLIRSADHGATWTPVGNLLDVNDAALLGATGPWGPQVNGADLFEANGAYYLYATPNGPVTSLGATTSGYRGCDAFQFADIDAGTLVRCGGAPVVFDSFQGSPGLFNGACTFAEGASAVGVMGLTADINRMPVFQLFATGVPGP
jgi:hypothetical protein